MCLPVKSDETAASSSSQTGSILGLGALMTLACLGGPVIARRARPRRAHRCRRRDPGARAVRGGAGRDAGVAATRAAPAADPGAVDAGARRWIAPFRASFPDVRMEILELMPEKERVVGRSRCSGTGRPAGV